MSKVLPTDDPLTLALEDERLFIGSLSIPCIWHDVRPNPVELPINAKLAAVLGVRLKHSEQEILSSGLLKQVNEAESQRKMLVRRVANALKPLGVRFEDVERLVDETLRRVNHL